MRQVGSLSHSRWECKYHVVFIPKYRKKSIFGYIKGKSAIHIARTFGERKRNFVGQSFWERGYFVSAVGRDEQVICEYIRHQESEDQRIDQLGLL